MADVSWPSAIKPLTNKNYSTSRGSNALASPVAGGLPRFGLDKTLESPVFNLNFSLSNLQYQVLLHFYDMQLNHGVNSFNMQLDSGQGLEEHQCNIIPGTWRVSKPVDCVWYLALSAQAEVTSSQLETCTNLFDLYSCYGDSLRPVINGLTPIINAMPGA
jgi:hypothetical protein